MHFFARIKFDDVVVKSSSSNLTNFEEDWGDKHTVKVNTVLNKLRHGTFWFNRKY